MPKNFLGTVPRHERDFHREEIMMPSTQSFYGWVTHSNTSTSFKIMSHWPRKLFTKLPYDVHSFLPMEVTLDIGHWLDLARGSWPLAARSRLNQSIQVVSEATCLNVWFMSQALMKICRLWNLLKLIVVISRDVFLCHPSRVTSRSFNEIDEVFFEYVTYYHLA